MKRASPMKRGAPLARGSKLTTRTRLPRGERLRQVGKGGKAIRRAIDAVRPLVLERDGHLCARCRDPKCKPLDLHHRRARSQGGEHTADNLVTLGRACHMAVTDHTAKDWRRWVETRKAVRS